LLIRHVEWVRSQMIRDRYDVVVVGGRCSGATTARLLAEAGLDVLVVNKSQMFAEVCSTHCINPVGVELLQRWGVYERILTETGCTPIKGISVQAAGSTEALVGTTPIPALAPERTLLDPLLLNLAGEAGAQIVWPASVVAIQDEGSQIKLSVKTSSGVYSTSATFVVGADGASSQMAALSGATTVFEFSGRCAGSYSYYGSYGSEFARFILGDDFYISVFPSSRGRAVAAVADWSASGGRFEQLIDEFCAHPREFDFASKLSKTIRFPMRTNCLRRSKGRVLLVGDAHCIDSPVSGVGIAAAFVDAQVVATALISNPSMASDELDELHDRRSKAAKQIFRLVEKVDRGKWDVMLFGSLLAKLHERQGELLDASKD
jgi:2-polyprenyl-6-methoxyphenol hydroxylase-like FAD-dependent oxidoreductase